MVTQQEFIQGLLEPLMTGMKPLALADAPGAVVRGVASGQPFSEAFSSVMSDPLSMEGRVYGEDVTGDPYSGMIFELLSDPAALAGLGAAGLGGVGMALGRRYARGAGSEAAEGVLERLMREGRSVDEALDLLWQGTNAEQALAQELEMGLARESAEGTVGHRFTESAYGNSIVENEKLALMHQTAVPSELPPTSYRLVDELMRLVEEDPARFLTREDIYSPEDLSGVMSEKQINRLRSKPSAQIEQGLFLPPGGAEEGQFIRSNLIKELLGGRGQAGIDDPLGPATAEVRELLMPHLKQLYESGAIPQEGIPISRLSRGYSDPLPEHAYQYYRNPSDVPFPTLMNDRSLGGAKYGYYPYREPETFPYGAREILTHRKLRPDEPGLNVNQLHPLWPSPTKEEGMSFVSHWRGGELPVSHEGTTKNTLHFTETQSGETIKGLEQDLTTLPGAEGVVQRYAGRIAPLPGGQDTGDVLRRRIASGAVQLGRGRGLDHAWLGPVRLPPEASQHEQSDFYYSMMGAARDLHEEVLGSPVPRVSAGLGQFGEAEDLFIHLKNTASELSDIPKGSFVNQAGKVVTPQLKSTAPENQRNILTSLFQVAQDPSLSGLSHSGAREVKLSVGLGSEKGRQLYGEVSPSGEVEGKVGNTIDDLQNIVDVYEGNISDREIMARQASGEVPESYSVFTERVAEEHNIDLRAMRSPEEGMPEPMDVYDLTLDEVLEGVDPEQIEGLKEEIRRLTAGAETESHRGMIEKYIKRVTGVEPVEVYPRGAGQQQGYGDPVKYYPLRTESGEWASPKVAALMEKLLKGGVPIVPGIIPLMMLQEREGSRYGS